MIVINRLLADQKFFRNSVVILPLISLVLLFISDYFQAGVFFMLIFLCYIRYFERRLKSTTRAYQYIIMQDGLGILVTTDNADG